MRDSVCVWLLAYSAARVTLLQCVYSVVGLRNPGELHHSLTQTGWVHTIASCKLFSLLLLLPMMMAMAMVVVVIEYVGV